jgi:hypothetical protein
MLKNTIGYYINQLPDGVREKAIANIKVQIGETLAEGYLNYKHPKVSSVAMAVKGAFNWGRSPEGEHYWFKICTQCPDYEKPKPMNPISAFLEALLEFGELVQELNDDDEAPQEKQEVPSLKPEPNKVEVKETLVTRPKTVTAAIRKVLGDIGIKVDTRYIFSDGRKQGVSVKVCGLKLSDTQKQEVRTRMEALGYTFHRINVPSSKYGSGYYAGAFSGTRFHFS